MSGRLSAKTRKVYVHASVHLVIPPSRNAVTLPADVYSVSRRDCTGAETAAKPLVVQRWDKCTDRSLAHSQSMLSHLVGQTQKQESDFSMKEKDQ